MAESQTAELVRRFGNQTPLSVIRIPRALHEEWSSHAFGMIVGYISSEGILTTSIGGVQRNLKGNTSHMADEVVCSTNSVELEEYLDDLRVIGPVNCATTFMHDMRDPSFLKSLLSTKQQASPPLLKSGLVTKPCNSPQSTTTLITQYEAYGLTQTRKSISQADLEKYAHTLFELLEQNRETGLSLTDIHNAVKLPPHHLKRILDRIADTTKERWGKKTRFFLQKKFQ